MVQIGNMETPSRIEPCGIEDVIPEALSDLVVTVRAAASEVGIGLHPNSARELRGMVRIMNAYYSNLIEGHNTRPRDIEDALAGLPVDEDRRPLAEEAVAHVRVQAWIDDLADRRELIEPTAISFIQEVHRRFYNAMPEEFRFTEMNGVRQEIIPGMFRSHGQEVAVGRHQPPSAERVPAFMDHYAMRYRGLTQGATGRILSIPAAHHRLNYIHPFLDGNGRVSRLVSHAMVRVAGIGGYGLWSISRGLARGLEDRNEYKTRMDMADTERQGALDGRGNLSQSRLESFSDWFLKVMLDQIYFSTAMLELGTLEDRYGALVRDVFPREFRSERLIKVVLRLGEMARGDAALALGTGERTARTTLKSLVEKGFLVSDTPKSPVRIGFPLHFRERLFPNLFSDAPIEISVPVNPVIR